MASIPMQALEPVLELISGDGDRNSVSLVSKDWYEMERKGRRHVSIRNCSTASPAMLTRRFPDVRSLTIKSGHALSDGVVPKGNALRWIRAAVAAYPGLEELRLKRLWTEDVCFLLIGMKLPKLRVLVVRDCDGFSTLGLASIAAHCSDLRTLDVSVDKAINVNGDWIVHFPDSFTSLEFLNVSCIDKSKPIRLDTLRRLVGRCPNLQTLRLNISLPIDEFTSLLLKAPRLSTLGIGFYTLKPDSVAMAKLYWALAECRHLKGLYLPSDVTSYHFLALYSLCFRLTFLDLSRSTLHCFELVRLLRRCPELEYLYVNSYIEDIGLEEVAATCKRLRVLKVSWMRNVHGYIIPGVTENGLLSVTAGCPELESISYCSTRMTNEALIKVAKLAPGLTSVSIETGDLKDPTNNFPFDDGFGAILRHCKALRRLLVDCLYTDHLLEHIGRHGKQLTLLHLGGVGPTTAVGLHLILSGCGNLRKLVVESLSYAGPALLANSERLEQMRFVLMLSCKVLCREARLLGVKHPGLNIEAVNAKGLLLPMTDGCIVENLYVYRTVAGPPELDTPIEDDVDIYPGIDEGIVSMGI